MAYTKNPVKKESSIKAIPNSFGLRVTIRERDVRGEISGDLKKSYPNENLPFFVVKRGYMKTLLNYLDDYIDICAYCIVDKASDEVLEEEDNRVIGYNEKLKFAFGEEKTGYKIFKGIVEDKRLDKVYPEPPENIIRHDINGNTIVWRGSSDQMKHEYTRTYTIVPIEILDKICRLIGNIADNHPMTMHQRAALRYARATVRGLVYVM